MRPFVFFHIPKCGGSSVRHAIRRSARGSGINPGQILDGWFQPTIDQMRGKKVVAGHIRWQDYLEAGLEDAVTFTLLRHPVDRSISFYYYQTERLLREKPPAIKKWGSCVSPERLKEMMLWKSVPQMDDCPDDIMDAFIDSQANLFVYYWSVDWVFPNMIEATCKRLQEFTGFGILERMTETRGVLNEIVPFGVPLKIGHDNRSNNRGAGPSIRSRIEEKLEIDMGVYNFALKTFDESLNDSPC